MGRFSFLFFGLTGEASLQYGIQLRPQSINHRQLFLDYFSMLPELICVVLRRFYVRLASTFSWD